MDRKILPEQGPYLGPGNSVFRDGKSAGSTIVKIPIGSFCRVSLAVCPKFAPQVRQTDLTCNFSPAWPPVPKLRLRSDDRT